MFTVEYFIKKFEAIPEEKWCMGRITDDQGRHCAMGHCLEKGTVSEELLALGRIFNSIVDSSNHNAEIWEVNDGFYLYKELGDTPKQRILNALYEVKNQEDSKEAVKFVQSILNSPVKLLTYETQN